MDIILHNLAVGELSVLAGVGQRSNIPAQEADAGWPMVIVRWPTGDLIDPLGSLTADEAEDAFAEQASGLAEGCTDLLWLETFSALEEAEAGVRGARRATELPVVVTMSYDTAGCTMMGVTGTEAGVRLAELGVAAMGANCGANLPDTEAAVAGIFDACGAIPVVSKANAGIPVWKGAELRFDGTPEEVSYTHLTQPTNREV